MTGLSGMPVDPITAGLKRSLLQAWESSGMSKAELARRIGCHEAEVRRILDPGTMTKLPRLDQAARALGGRLVVSLEPIRATRPAPAATANPGARP